MIRRVVTVKLKDAYATDEERAQIAAHSRDVLRTVPGVRAVEVGVPADGFTRRQWDLCILVQFDDLAAVEAYRTDTIHRAFADVFLKPLRDKIRVSNFEITGGETAAD